MAEPTLLRADEVDPDQLYRFLQRFYGPAKSAFLQRHGAWWHRGQHNRWAVEQDGRLAGYCAVIPTTCWLQGAPVQALWWVDLVVAPECRGRGLQRLMDEHMKTLADLKLGFPNELAARIHRKHHWGVRDDLQVMLLPLRPSGVKRVRTAVGARRRMLQAGALAAAPLAARWRRRLRRYAPAGVRAVDTPDPDVLASVFARYQAQAGATTYRDAAFFRWRYLDAPYPVRCFLAGLPEAPTHYLLARHLKDEGVRTTRILDLFGDFEDVRALRDVVHVAAREALHAGSAQVTALTSLRPLARVLRSAGFWFTSRTRFCWHSPSEAAMQALAGPAHWTLADSDNDEVTGLEAP